MRGNSYGDGVVTGSGLSTHGVGGPRGGRGHGRRASCGVHRASGECRGGTTRCVVRVCCRRQGRHSCGMPIIHKRHGHPGTVLGAVRPVGA
eukprot:3252062-Prymnesium_polylepis.1